MYTSMFSVYSELPGILKYPDLPYGLEIPCKYHFFGSTTYIERMKTIVDRQCSEGLL